MKLAGPGLLITILFVVVVAAIVSVVVLGGSARVRSKVRRLASEHPEAIAFAGYIYPFRFGSISGATMRPSDAPRPFAFLADSNGVQIFGPWRSRLRREVTWSAVARVEFDVLQASRFSLDGLTIFAANERASIDIRPVVPDLSALIDGLEALRTESQNRPSSGT